MGKPERHQRMIERIVLYARQLTHLIDTESAEIAHLMTKIDIVLLVAGLFRSVGGKYQSLLHLRDVVIVFLVEMKGGAETMSLIEMIEVGIEPQFIHQFGPSYPQQDELSDFCRYIGVIQTMGNGLGDIIIFRQVRAQ